MPEICKAPHDVLMAFRIGHHAKINLIIYKLNHRMHYFHNIKKKYFAFNSFWTGRMNEFTNNSQDL